MHNSILTVNINVVQFPEMIKLIISFFMVIYNFLISLHLQLLNFTLVTNHPKVQYLAIKSYTCIDNTVEPGHHSDSSSTVLISEVSIFHKYIVLYVTVTFETTVFIFQSVLILGVSL